MFHTKIYQCEILSRFAPSSLPFLAVQCLSKASGQTTYPMKEKWGEETRSDVFPTPGPVTPAILLLLPISHLVVNIPVIKVCTSVNQTRKNTLRKTSTLWNCIPQSISPSDKQNWGKGQNLLAGLQTHDQRPKAGHSEIKHLVLESDHWNKAAFHLREGIIIHSFS